MFSSGKKSIGRKKSLMKALVFTDKEKLEYQSMPMPVIKEQELLVKVSGAGICGSDMHAYHGFDSRRIPPLILGHEISGTIENSDQSVIVNPLVTCGSCYECKNEIDHLCQSSSFIGMSKPIERHGGFAEYVSVPKKNLHYINKTNILSTLSLTEPTAVSLHAIELAKKHSIKQLKESKIIIIGGGAIGLLTGLILNSIGIVNYTIIDTNKKRLDVCKKASGCQIYFPDDHKVKKNSYDLVFDAVGLEKTRKQSIECVKQGGTIIHIGLSQPAGEFDFRKTTLQEIIFIGSSRYTDQDFKKSINIIEDNKLGDLNWLDFRSLSDGSNAFREIHDGSTASPKIILIP